MTIQGKFLGAAGTVTGSRTLLNYGRKRILVDCGLFQGPKELRLLNWNPFPIEPRLIDAVVLTHAHLDHSGLLPKLVREGFQGPIYASAGTVDLCEILLRDSARLQEEDADYAQRTKYSHYENPQPLYTTKDVERCLKQFKELPRHQWQTLEPGLQVRMGRAGHITGACFLEFATQVNQKNRILAFSGDVGHTRSLVLRPPEAIEECDILVMESTYGDRLHDRGDICESMSAVVREVVGRKGVLMIPSFAVGRTQEVLYLIAEMERRKLIPEVPVLLDSPMAEAATDVFVRHEEDHIFGKAFGPRVSELFPKHFEHSRTAEDSMMSVMRDGPAIVLAGAGMVTGGRILHHLKHRLPDSRHGVLFVGYQSEGSKGRYLLEEAPKSGRIRIHHREIHVEASIHQISGLSAHGDYEDLLDWVGRIRRKPSKIFLNHGDPKAAQAFAVRLQERLGIEAVVARQDETFTLGR